MSRGNETEKSRYYDKLCEETLRSTFISLCLLSVLGCGAQDRSETAQIEGLPLLGKELSQNSALSIMRVEERKETGISIDQDGMVIAESRSLIDVLRYLCPERHYLKTEVNLPAGVYDITIKPSQSQDAYELLKEELQCIFALTILLQDLIVAVNSLVVVTTNRPPDGMRISNDQRGLRGHDGKNFKNYDMQAFSEIIDSCLEDPALNKTELSGKFDFSFDLLGVRFQPSHLRNELSRIGLELKKDKANIRHMIINRKDI